LFWQIFLLALYGYEQPNSTIFLKSVLSDQWVGVKIPGNLIEDGMHAWFLN